MVHIAPSILAADFARLGDQVVETEKAGANRIQVDVMDGHFVPNLSMGPVVVRGLRRVTRLALEIHLMVQDPERFAGPFVQAGADSLIAHYEVLPDPLRFVRQVRSQGKQVGLALKPETPVEVLEPLLAEIDVALCMTVHPGFGGQKFLPDSPPRIGRLRELIELRNPRCELEVDGGIDRETLPAAVAAGANVLVMGTAIFGAAEGPAAAVRAIHGLLSSNPAAPRS